MMSLRLEKSFGSWLREYKPDYTPAETGLDRFISFQKPVALGFVPVDLIDESNTFEIEILGDRRPATLVTEPLFDPAGERMRG
tara:strand:+ start:5111 stop:5359 length:249 start_codon:yes stop_codon:yes gene_type:complete